MFNYFHRHPPRPPLAPDQRSVHHCAAPLHEILAQVPAQARLILRSPGLTVSRIIADCSSWPGIQDELILHHPEELACFAFACPVDDSLVVALRQSDGAIPLSLHFTTTCWESAEVAQLLRVCDSRPSEAPGIWKNGAGAWLDEMSFSEAHPPLELFYLLSLIDESSAIHAHADTAYCSLGARFRPVFIDINDSVIRLADRLGHHAIFFHPLHVRSVQRKNTLHLHTLAP
ncbi:hypothetical protein ACFQY0_14200 [Haloferula chungangensis]|uniref:Uncharacterized protein n=1 Tax=Haloferula chungangensis TaxID=1048331 RepID=A0ABW2L7H6_9BACT